MARWGQTLCGRVALLTLFWVLGGLADARPARAMGCHAPDRPVLGLSISLESSDLAPGESDRLVRPNPLVRPIPCSGDLPGAPGRHAPTQLLASVTPFTIEPAEGRYVLAETLPARPPAGSSRLDRPPRSPAPTP